MNYDSGQISQYKDALKLMKKKCQSTETQYNDLKAKYDRLESSIVYFLEYITKPFSDSNLKPDLTNDGLRCWWDIKKQGLYLKEKKDVEAISPTRNDTVSSLQIRIGELNAQLKKAEYDRKDMEFSLNRRSAEIKAITDTSDQLKNDLESTREELSKTMECNTTLQSQLSTSKNQITSLFMSISQFLDLHCDREDELKSGLYLTVRQIFPKLKNSEPDEDIASNKCEIELVLMSAIDRVGLLKSSYRSLSDELQSKSDILVSQTKQIADLMRVSDSDNTTIARLHRSLEALQQPALQGTAQMSQMADSETKMAELEQANASLRSALQSMRESMDVQLQRSEACESRLVAMQNELVAVQRSSSDMVQQMHTAGDEKIREQEAEKEELRHVADQACSEAAALRTTLEQATKQYEQELAVLRERKYAVEQQVTVSEKFLDTNNRTHREEVSRLMVAQLEALKETQELRVTLLEKETELRSCQEGCETLREQLQSKIRELNGQLNDAEQRLLEENAKYSEEKKVREISETEINATVAERVHVVEQKERESSRFMQRQFEEELVRVRKQVQVLSHQLDEERKSGRKTRERLIQITDQMTLQDQAVEKMKSEIAQRDSELLAGRQQINKLSLIISQRFGEASGF